jgi:predicted Na+-dependent transporter
MIAITLLVLVIPLGLGILFSHKWPAKGARIHQLIAKKFFIAYLVGLFLVAIYSFQYTFWLITWRHVLTGFLMGTLVYVFGAGLEIVCLLKRAQIIAISLETALQNGAIALVVMNVTFVSPYAEIGLLPIAGYVICSTTLMLLPLYILKLCYKRCSGQESLAQTHDDIQKKRGSSKTPLTSLKEATNLNVDQTELPENQNEAEFERLNQNTV